MYIHILTVYPACLTVYPACLTDVHLYTEGKTNKITEMKSLGHLDHALEAINQIITPKATDVVSLPATTH